jgi:ATP-dependent DNA ligase
MHLLSRNLKELSEAFPELVRAGRDLPLDVRLDGEIVIAAAAGRSNFGAVAGTPWETRRDSARAALRALARFLAFDLVRDAGRQ